MRVIGGTYRSRRLLSVPSDKTRPTTDRVREAWASTMESLLEKDIEQTVLLDAFAGSGALGIELLSRGAKRVVFCENNRIAQKTIEDNLMFLGIPQAPAAQAPTVQAPSAHLLKDDIFLPNTLKKLAKQGPFDALVFDPPYKMEQRRIANLLADLSRSVCLAAGCIISYEQAMTHRLSQEEMLLWLEAIPCTSDTSFILETRKIYGTVALDYFRYSKK